MSKDKDSVTNHIRNLKINSGELVEYRGYDILISAIMNFPFESCNMVAGVKKYTYQVVDKNGNVVDERLYSPNPNTDEEVYLANAKAKIDSIIK